MVRNGDESEFLSRRNKKVSWNRNDETWVGWAELRAVKIVDHKLASTCRCAIVVVAAVVQRRRGRVQKFATSIACQESSDATVGSCQSNRGSSDDVQFASQLISGYE